jgi:phosphoglycerate kinase
VGEANRKFVANQDYLEHVPVAQRLLEEYRDKIAVPVDVAVNKNGERLEVKMNEIPLDLPIADIGLETIADYSKILRNSKVSVLNGPTGIFELEKFKLGTVELLKAATSSCYSIAGGGHTVTAIDKLGLKPKFSHISMGGGASITYLSGESMPGIEALKKAAERQRNHLE